jgi:hypothetical protein
MHEKLHFAVLSRHAHTACLPLPLLTVKTFRTLEVK